MKDNIGDWFSMEELQPVKSLWRGDRGWR